MSTPPKIAIIGHTVDCPISIPKGLGQTDLEISKVSVGATLLDKLFGMLAPTIETTPCKRKLDPYPEYDRQHFSFIELIQVGEDSLNKNVTLRIARPTRGCLRKELGLRLLVGCNELEDANEIPDIALTYLDAACLGLTSVNLPKLDVGITQVVYLDTNAPYPSKADFGHFLSTLTRCFKNGTSCCVKRIVVSSARVMSYLGSKVRTESTWEATAEDVWRELLAQDKNQLLPVLREICKYLIIRLQGPAVLVCTFQNNSDVTMRIIYQVEDDKSPAQPGDVWGTTALLAVSVAGGIAIEPNDLDNEEPKGVKNGIRRANKLEKGGYRIRTEKNQDITEKFDGAWRECCDVTKSSEPPFKAIPIDSKWIETNRRWSILGKIIATEKNVRSIGKEIVELGIERAQERHGFPIARFEEAIVVDRREFEKYVDIKLCIRNYLLDRKRQTPLSLAVFGKPGSGKSFGIEQLVKSIGNEGLERDPIKEDVSQFDRLEDLARTLHRIRNVTAEGKVPLVFFDEFDTSFSSTPFGWLRYFLAPMQNGTFSDGKATYTIGRTILCFIGGINHSFEMLESRQRNAEFISAKGPDFISRLSGHLDVLGVSRFSEDDDDEDPERFVRRGVLLRSFLEKYHSAAINHRDNRANVDERVVDVLLSVRDYKHGARSLEAIIRMCHPSPGSNSLWWTDLPSPAQLDMHVSLLEFLRADAERSEYS
jgi:hypothetical protein